jgi:hypothetical protein
MCNVRSGTGERAARVRKAALLCRSYCEAESATTHDEHSEHAAAGHAHRRLLAGGNRDGRALQQSAPSHSGQDHEVLSTTELRTASLASLRDASMTGAVAALHCTSPGSSCSTLVLVSLICAPNELQLLLWCFAC